MAIDFDKGEKNGSVNFEKGKSESTPKGESINFEKGSVANDTPIGTIDLTKGKVPQEQGVLDTPKPNGATQPSNLKGDIAAGGSAGGNGEARDRSSSVSGKAGTPSKPEKKSPSVAKILIPIIAIMAVAGIIIAVLPKTPDAPVPTTITSENPTESVPNSNDAENDADETDGATIGTPVVVANDDVANEAETTEPAEETISVEETTWDNPYDNISENDWYYADVRFVVENGLMTGVSPVSFAQDEMTTNAMLVTILWRISEKPESTTVIDDNSWYSAAASWVQECGIFNEVEDGQFAPSEAITRERLAVMLFRYAEQAGLSLPQTRAASIFEDVTDENEAINALYKAEIISGKNETSFAPQDQITRAETASVIRKFIELTK